MISIINIGMNHQSAPVELRECLSGDKVGPAEILELMRKSEFISECIFISTCNRVETICTATDPDQAEKVIIDLMAQAGTMPVERLRSHMYLHKDMDAVRHIFRVAASLDSMVVGEPQILGQVKEAFRLAAVKERSTGVILNRLMHKTFQVAKRVRTETGISETAVSISYAAVELAKKIFYGLEGRVALLIGAGEMAELAAKHLVCNGITELNIVNRSFERAVELAGSIGGKAALFDEMEEQLVKADIVISSTAATNYIITADMIKNILRKRKNRTLFLIDIAVPRDIEPKVNSLENCFLYDIDDLKEVVNENSTQRMQEALRAERIIEEEVIKFGNWLSTLDVVPTIVLLKEKVEEIRRAELRRSMSQLQGLTGEQIEAIETLTLSMAEKMVNDPILALKNISSRASKDSFIDITKRLFNLDKEKT
ncbi:MAG: glutamyl-tRNA reductase [Deltaproteobacteria bacterium]|nr:glutamyl-tRNA reductase [Deltaproteobacteria bacterium]